tara:strand:- start:714 stop:1700 length:987 start_codon:yes stop_codon:yes gene_type:complete
MIKIAINGFGRIGRVLFRVLSNIPNYKVVVINDLAPPKTLSHLLKYDTIHGRFSKNVSYNDKSIFIDGQEIKIINITKLNKLNWSIYNVDVVFECSGNYKRYEQLKNHITNGAKKVILTSPSNDENIPMVVLGVNDSKVDFSSDIISNASCTTNCAAPMIDIINNNLKIESAYVTTIHSFTGDQNLHDSIHNDLRRARSAPSSIIPTTTGAAKALSKIFPNLTIGGCGIRVPVNNCSLTDITFFLKNSTTEKFINLLYEKASKKSLNGLLKYINDPIVSVDVKSSPYSCTFDSQLTYVSRNMVKVVGWYDNEYGYSSRLVDLLSKIKF